MNQMKIIFVLLFTCSFAIKDLSANDRPLPWPWPFKCIPEVLHGSWSGTVDQVGIYYSSYPLYDRDYELKFSLEKDSVDDNNDNYDMKKFTVEIDNSKFTYHFFKGESYADNKQFLTFSEIKFFTKERKLITNSINSRKNCGTKYQKNAKIIELKFRKPYTQSDTYSVSDKVRFYFNIISRKNR